MCNVSKGSWVKEEVCLDEFGGECGSSGDLSVVGSHLLSICVAILPIFTIGFAIRCFNPFFLSV